MTLFLNYAAVEHGGESHDLKINDWRYTGEYGTYIDDPESWAYWFVGLQSLPHGARGNLGYEYDICNDGERVFKFIIDRADDRGYDWGAMDGLRQHADWVAEALTTLLKMYERNRPLPDAVRLEITSDERPDFDPYEEPEWDYPSTYTLKDDATGAVLTEVRA